MPAASPPAAGTLTCPECGTHLASYSLKPAEEIVCPGCRLRLRGQVFPMWWKSSTSMVTRSEQALDGDAVCFFHPSNRAALTCDSCGRFLCTICDLPLGSRHLCPSCLSSGLGKDKIPEIIPRRFLWARTAFWIGLLPVILGLFLWPFFVVTGPTAVIVALVGWKRPGSLVRGRQRWAAVTGIILGLLQVVFWIGFVLLIRRSSSR